MPDTTPKNRHADHGLTVQFQASSARGGRITETPLAAPQPIRLQINVSPESE